MATKKQNRRNVVRRNRRILNRGVDMFKFVGNNINKIKYGCGLSKQKVNEHA